MTKKEEVEAFKNELQNLNFYKKKIKECKLKRDLQIYELENVKGVDYTKQHGTYNEAAAENKRLSMIEELKEIEEDLKVWETKKKHICKVLGRMNDYERLLVVDVVANKRRYADVCEERKIKNTSSLFGMINNIIYDAIKKAR